MDNGTIIESLLNEYIEHRRAIKEMITDLEKLKVRTDELFPESLDKRYIRFFEEKIKSVTALFNSLLDMRKEIAKSIKDEIEIRRRLESGGKDLDDLFDMRSLVKQVETFQKGVDKSKEKVKEVMKDEKDRSDDRVAG